MSFQRQRDIRENDRRGQALILFVVALGVFLLGALGLAVDASMLYGNRQMAQAAADAAAQAGAMSILGETNTGTNAFGGATINACASTAVTPCYYASRNGFMTASDTVKVEFPTTVPGVASCATSSPPCLATDVTPAAVKVTITRSVPTTFMKVLGVSSGTVSASATAAIVSNPSPPPILALDPSDPGALTVSGNVPITISGGPQKSIQVDSNSATAASFTQVFPGGMNLSSGGPQGTGSDLGVFGGPASAPARVSFGTGNYVQPAVRMNDPLSGVVPPAQPAAAGPQTQIAFGTDGCQASTCTLFSPGDYPGGITVAANQNAVFLPGVYYVDSGGFSNAANSNISMCLGCAASGDTGNTGMLVYLAGGNVDLSGLNSNVTMAGSSASSAYKGILFFISHNAPAQPPHLLGDVGNGKMFLQGTIYATDNTASAYQTVSLLGTACSVPPSPVEIIADKLAMGLGHYNSPRCIKLQLDSSYLLPVDQVALVK